MMGFLLHLGTAAALLLTAGVAVSALPWTDEELAESMVAFATLGQLPALARAWAKRSMARYFRVRGEERPLPPRSLHLAG